MVQPRCAASLAVCNHDPFPDFFVFFLRFCNNVRWNGSRADGRLDRPDEFITLDVVVVLLSLVHRAAPGRGRTWKWRIPHWRTSLQCASGGTVLPEYFGNPCYQPNAALPGELLLLRILLFTDCRYGETSYLFAQTFAY